MVAVKQKLQKPCTNGYNNKFTIFISSMSTKNYYSKFNTKELIEIYTNTMTNYGKVEGDLLEEINNRGGIATLEQQAEQYHRIATERTRIIREVIQLTGSGTDATFIKQLIQSDLLSQEELDSLVENTYQQQKNTIEHKQINAKTIVGCLLGFVIGSILGGLICFAQLYYWGEVYYATFVASYAVAYLPIRIITKKNATNPLVLITALIASIVGTILPLLYFGLL